MSNPNYTLEIISHHPKFSGKSLKKYYVEGIETIGAWGDEPFEIRFKNNTFQKVQVKISVDGTDVLTGKPADTLASNEMWVVNGYDTITLKAWPEDNNGGAGFVFTSANNSVAIHTHGDLSSRGIIAAAVFTEGHVEPIKYAPPTYVPYPVYPSWPYNTPYITTSPIWVYNNGTTTYGDGGTGGTFGSTFTSSCSNSISEQDMSYNAAGGETIGAIFNCTMDAAPAATPSGRSRDSRKRLLSPEKLVAVGAGQHVDQKITYVTGLIKPLFAETVRVKYLWWDDLVAKLRTVTAATAQPSGFPGDHARKNIDLKGTPRIGDRKGSFRRADAPSAPVFERV